MAALEFEFLGSIKSFGTNGGYGERDVPEANDRLKEWH